MRPFVDSSGYRIIDLSYEQCKTLKDMPIEAGLLQPGEEPIEGKRLRLKLDTTAKERLELKCLPEDCGWDSMEIAEIILNPHAYIQLLDGGRVGGQQGNLDLYVELENVGASGAIYPCSIPKKRMQQEFPQLDL